MGVIVEQTTPILVAFTLRKLPFVCTAFPYLLAYFLVGAIKKYCICYKSFIITR